MVYTPGNQVIAKIQFGVILKQLIGGVSSCHDPQTFLASRWITHHHTILPLHGQLFTSPNSRNDARALV